MLSLLLLAALSAQSPDGRLLAELESGTLLVKDAEGKELLRRRTGLDPETLRFSPDGKRVGVLGKNGKGESFEIAKPEAPAREADLGALWEALLGSDGGAASRELVGIPELSVPFLAARMRPVRMDDAAILALIRNLDHDEYKTREEASAALGSLGRAAEPYLRKALADTSSAEVRARCETLLENLESGRAQPKGETLRNLRAIQILGLQGGEEAKAALRAVAEGAPGAAETEAARKALASR